MLRDRPRVRDRPPTPPPFSVSPERLRVRFRRLVVEEVVVAAPVLVLEAGKASCNILLAESIVRRPFARAAEAADVVVVVLVLVLVLVAAVEVVRAWLLAALVPRRILLLGLFAPARLLRLLLWLGRDVGDKDGPSELECGSGGSPSPSPVDDGW